MIIRNLDSKKYLLNLLKQKKMNDIKDINFVGAFLHSNEIEQNIVNQTISMQSVNELIALQNFDVRKDDIISVYSFISSGRNYFAFINEPYELLFGNYLINVIEIP